MCFIMVPVMALPAQLRVMHIDAENNRTRIILEADQPFRYHGFGLSHPDRFVLDVADTKAHFNLSNLAWAQTPILRLRTGTGNLPHTLRLVFDLKYPAHPQLNAVIHRAHEPYQLVITIPHGAVKYATASTPVLEKVSSPAESAEIRRPIIIVIDPGHGGKDPGATGPSGILEKNVVLAIGTRLKELINAQPGFKAILTRGGNYYVPLRQRMEIARRHKADMFISVHADAYRYAHARGVSVYALSERGATSEAARWLAERENQSELMGGVELDDKDRMLRSVLISLSQTATTRSSLVVGNKLLRHLGHVTALHKGRVEQAAFVVLKSPDIPSVLIETGYLSNPYEEVKLRSETYQQLVASAIMQGVVQYFKQEPPRGTYFAHADSSTG